MKKILLTYIVILLLAISSTNSQPPYVKAKEYEHVVVNEQLKPYFNRFVKLMKDNKIPVDYNLLTTVDLLPLYFGVQGIYSPTTKGVAINYYIQFPILHKLTKEEKDDFVFIVLAHEIGHAMLWEHIEAESIGLMHPTSENNLSIIRGSLGADQYVINTYKYHLCN